LFNEISPDSIAHVHRLYQNIMMDLRNYPLDVMNLHNYEITLCSAHCVFMLEGSVFSVRKVVFLISRWSG